MAFAQLGSKSPAEPFTGCLWLRWIPRLGGDERTHVTYTAYHDCCLQDGHYGQHLCTECGGVWGEPSGAPGRAT
jgi:hypothetical protein